MELKDICEAAFYHMEEYQITLTELIQVSGLTMEEIQVLIEFGVLSPKGDEQTDWLFSDNCILLARKAKKLGRDFELTPVGIALLLLYQAKIHELEDRLRALECHLLK